MMAKVSLDLVRAKTLPQSEDAFEPLSTNVKIYHLGDLQPDGLTDLETGSPFQVVTSHVTRTMPTNNAPFYNESYEFPLPFDPKQPPATQSSLTLRLVFVIQDAMMSDKPLFYAKANIDCKSNGKGERTVELYTQDLLKFVDEPKEENMVENATILLRFKTHIPKVKKEVEDVNADIILPEEPKVNGDRPLVPTSTQYIWWHLLHDDDWTTEFGRVLTDTVTNLVDSAGLNGSASSSHAPKKGSRGGSAAAERSAGPAKNIADVVVNKWKCKRGHQVLTKLRLCGTKFAHGSCPIIFTAEEEALAKVEYLENAVAREKMILNPDDASAGKIREKFDRLWMFFVANIPLEGKAPMMNYELSVKLDSTPFGRPQQEVLQSCLLRLLVPSMSQAQAEAIAKEDCDPVHFEQPLFKSPVDPNPPAVPPAAPTSPTAPGVGGIGRTAPKIKEREFFFKILRRFGCRLCDTLTQCEFMMMLDSFVPAVQQAREICKTIIPAAPVGISKLPIKPGSGKPSGGRRASARRKSSVSASGGKRKSLASGASSGAAAAKKEQEQQHSLGGPLHLKHLDELGRPKQK